MFQSLFRHCYRHRLKPLKHKALYAFGERVNENPLFAHICMRIYTHTKIYI